ncbi:MAG: hypothetical protein U0271_14230 [Polyangiaceae bacterium]
MCGMAACGSKGLGGKGKGATTLKASDAKWKDTELSIGKANAKFFMTGSNKDKDPLFMNTYFSDFPAGAEVTVGETKGTTSESGYLSLDVDMNGKVGGQSLKAISNGAVDLGVQITIKAKDSETIEEKLPAMRVEAAVAAGLAKVRDGAVKFDGEPADDGKVGSIALVEVSSLSQIKLVGSADKLWDIDWVAVSEKRESGRVKACSGYEKTAGDVNVTQVDSVVKIYDRRSGKLVAEKTFQPKDECPSFAMVSKDKTAKNYVSDSDIEPWVRENFDKARQ